MNKNRLEHITIRLSPETRVELEKKCEQYDIPISSLMRFYIKYGLKNIEILDKERAL